ncbi:CHASE domain-containing protein [Undibacterium sp.]|jgi:PAS domain S-box-containing protein|uniref:CHASE domain-containing protein n=1 Tax=Undibacterium sp. TaxID=1914977 RepID=UPI002D0BC9D3|nr:CHASE domain-containing protein [Undibacterium sp.]HTD06892.1 CHASE domain-containing protein [Undibacterium sp.]
MPLSISRISGTLLSRTWPRILALAFVYMLLGRLSLLLAIPPGYAMAVYPPAGIALGIVLIAGYRLLPGVALGSFLVNLLISWETGGGLSAAAVVLSVLLAGGATLQAFAGSCLVRRFVGENLALDSDTSIFRFFLYGGILASLVSASVAALSLYGLHFIPGNHILGNWATWWTGDTLGVLITTPIVMVLFGKPREIWSSRRWNVMLPLAICLAVVVVVFTYIRHREEQKQFLEFRLEVERVSQDLQNKLNNHTDAVSNIERFFASSRSVNRSDFSTFVQHTIESNKAITSLIWAPKVRRADKTAFEAAVLQEGYANFSISEKGANGKLMPAAERDDYFPITYIEPFRTGTQAFGFDMGSNDARRNAIEEARDSGNLTVTDPLVLVTDKGEQYSVLLYAPVYLPGKPLDSTWKRAEAFQGVAVSVLRMGEVIEDLLSKQDQKSILIKFYDLSYPGKKGTFYDAIKVVDTKRFFQSTINFGGRQYALLAQPSTEYWDTHVSWVTWFTMIGGLLFTSLLGIYLLVVTAHTFNVEILVAQRTSQLHDSEERLRAILANAAEGILTMSPSGFIESANQSAEILFDYPRGALFGRNILSLFPDPASEAFLLGYMQDQRESHEKQARQEVVGSKRLDQEIPLELAIARAELGSQTLLVLILHDLSERKRVERLKGEFVAAVSHELRTPLTSIRGSLGLLVGGIAGTIPDKAKTLLDMANDNAERLLLLINDLLDFEKLEYGGMQFNLQATSLRDLVKKSVDANKGYTQKFTIALVFDAKQSVDAIVNVDQQRFIQVLSNLLSNAIKFSRKDGRVEVHISRANGWARVAVVDHGIGISKQFQGSVFHKFTQEDANSARKYAGTGLGLSLTKTMVEKMGGRIGFTSVESEGSTFYVELPVAQ